MWYLVTVVHCSDFNIYFWIRNSFRIATYLVVLLLLGLFFKKAQGSVVSNRIGMKFSRNLLQIDTHRMSDDVDFLIWRHIFQMVFMWSFYAEKCCHLVSTYSTSLWCICCSICQFLIRVHLYLLCLVKGDLQRSTMDKWFVRLAVAEDCEEIFRLLKVLLALLFI